MRKFYARSTINEMFKENKKNKAPAYNNFPSKDISSQDFRNIVSKGVNFTLKLVFVLIIVGVVFFSIFDSGAINNVTSKLDLGAIIFICSLALANYAIRAFRFQRLLGWLGHHLAYGRVAHVYIAGFSLSATPGKLGEFIRMFLLRARYRHPLKDTAAALITDRASDVLAVTCLCLVSLSTFSEYSIAVIILAAVLAGLTLLLMRPDLLIRVIGGIYALVGWKARLFAGLRATLRRTSRLFQARYLLIGIGLGIAGWGIECYALYYCACLFSDLVTLRQAIFIFTFSSLVGAATLVPGGLGGTEISMAALLVLAGLPLDEAAAVTLIIRAGTLWFGIACGNIALGLWLFSRKL